MKLTNPKTGSSIKGEKPTPTLVRGERAKKVTFIPEGATAQEAWEIVMGHMNGR